MKRMFPISIFLLYFFPSFGIDASLNYPSNNPSNSSNEESAMNLLYFNASNANGGILVHWVSGSDIKGSYYVLEKSHNGDDWAEVLTIEVNIDSDSPTHYKSYEESGDDKTFYRIKQVFYSGSSTYSKIKSIANVIKEEHASVIPECSNSMVCNFNYQQLNPLE